MFRKLVLLVIILGCLGCKKPSPSPAIDANVSLEFRNQNGEDLLNPATQNAILKEDIDVFVLQNNVRARLYQSNLDRPEFFYIDKGSNGTYFLNLLFDIRNENLDGDKVTQFLRFKDGSEDKIAAIFKRDKYRNTFIQKMYVNDVLKWELGPQQSKPANALILIK